VTEDKQCCTVLVALWTVTCKERDPVQFSVGAGGKSVGAWS